VERGEVIQNSEFRIQNFEYRVHYSGFRMIRGALAKNVPLFLRSVPLFLGILFLVMFSTAFAAGERPLRAGCPSRSGETVLSRTGKNGIILSLPGFWDPTAVTLEVNGTDRILIGKEKREITAGEPTDLTDLIGKKTEVRDGKGVLIGQMTILQGSRIPAVFLEVDGEKLKAVGRSKENVITEGRAVCTEADGTVSYDGDLTQLKGRGNNTFRYLKKPYQIKLSEKTSLSGLGKGRTWVLLANWTDISLLRNRIVLDMSREIGLRNAVGCAPADVWINGLYQGLYLMSEKIQIGKERIPVRNLEKETEKVNEAPLKPGPIVTEKDGEFPLIRSYPAVKDPEDITGGYIATIEKYPRMKDYVIAGFRTAQGLSIQIKEPTYPSKAQAEYLARRITEMQEALIAEDGVHPESGKRFDEYLDTASFARRFLIEDWCKNYDYVGGSQFLYKDSDRTDPLIYAGPSWDYDLSFGNMKDRGYSSGGRHVVLSQRTSNIWWLLSRHESFMEQVREIWTESFRPAAAVLLGEKERQAEGILKSLDEYRAEIEASAAMNFARWGINSDASAKEAGESFDHAFRYLKNWIAERTAWMDGQYGRAE